MRSAPRSLILMLLLTTPLLGGAEECGDPVPIGMDSSETDQNPAQPGGDDGTGDKTEDGAIPGSGEATPGDGDSDGNGSGEETPGGAVPCGSSECSDGQVCCNASCGVCTDPGGACTQEVCEPEEEDVPCGDNVCTGGQVCCNASCGVCTDPGGACTQEVCEPEEEEIPCGDNVCTGGQVCCNPSCGACIDPGGFCTQEVCEPEEEDVPCGDNVCTGGQVCCNASCGICTDPGGACTQQACPPANDCELSECVLPAPVAPNVQCWDGSIAGPVCDRGDDGQCGWEIRQCPETVVCGGFAGLACPGDDQYCDYAAGDGCSSVIADGQGECRVRPEGCPDVYDPVCTCDGRTVSNACDAAQEGLSVAHPGPCTARECQDRGGRLVFSDGASNPQCEDGEEDLGLVVSGDNQPFDEPVRCCL